MLDKIQLTLCLIVIVTVFAITSCGAPSRSSDIVSRYVDREAGVVCWTYQSGISCLPIDATTLQR